MMMTSSSAQMLLLSTLPTPSPSTTPGPGPCPHPPLVTPGLKPWFTPLYSSADNPRQHAHAHTHTQIHPSGHYLRGALFCLLLSLFLPVAADCSNGIQLECVPFFVWPTGKPQMTSAHLLSSLRLICTSGLSG